MSSITVGQSGNGGGEVRQGVDLCVSSCRFGSSGVDVAPWTSADEDCAHPVRPGGENVVVEPVADVEDLMSGDSAGVDDVSEERWRGLLDSPLA
jgi:hypothetical protein